MLEKLTFVLPNEADAYTFHMNYAYDSWNRMLSMSYPDGEEVNYAYDVGGNLRSVTGTNGWQTHRYVDNISYDKFGNRTRIEYGNRVFTNYSYDLLQRLSTMDTYDPTATAYLQQLTYTYDGVGNITRLVNASGQVYEMGGAYENKYDYDPLNRLEHYTGEWEGSPDVYELMMGYSPGGRIEHKYQFYNRKDFNHETRITNFKDYSYEDVNSPNRLTGIYDQHTNAEYLFNWDPNGNMWSTVKNEGSNRTSMYHSWDEENRMIGISGNNYSINSNYYYSAEGERTYKLNGGMYSMIINGSLTSYILLDHASLYVSPYLVASDRGCSKHIYAGTERIASHPLTGSVQGIDDHISIGSIDEMREKQEKLYIALNDMYNWNIRLGWNLLDHLRSTSRNMPKDEIYYYHTDHLGSSSWITYTDGIPVQYLSYMPFGESQMDQRSGDWNSRYTFYPEFIEGFSGKERDEETGYSYFGARYYDPDISIWLSRDPLSHLYPHQSPYVYCSNNPIKRIDPNGMADGNFYDWNGKYLGWDGNKDNNVFIVGDDESAHTIKKTQKAGGTTNAGDIKIDVSTTKEALSESINVYNRTIDNGGFSEESSVVSPDGNNIVRGQTGPDQRDGGRATADLPYMSGSDNISIHFHPTGETESGRIWVPEKLGGLDSKVFKDFGLNIVVGKFQVSTDAIGGYRESGAVFYDRNSNQIGNMTFGSIRKILKR